jgi:hypothetical protein
MVRNTKNVQNEKHTLGIWRKYGKTWKLKNAHCVTGNMARKLKNVENETQILYELEYGEKK